MKLIFPPALSSGFCRAWVEAVYPDDDTAEIPESVLSELYPDVYSWGPAMREMRTLRTALTHKNGMRGIRQSGMKPLVEMCYSEIEKSDMKVYYSDPQSNDLPFVTIQTSISAEMDSGALDLISPILYNVMATSLTYWMLSESPESREVARQTLEVWNRQRRRRKRIFLFSNCKPKRNGLGFLGLRGVHHNFLSNSFM